jgi:hypothetical protein
LRFYPYPSSSSSAPEMNFPSGGLVQKLEGRDNLEDLDVDGNKLLKRTFKNWMRGCRLDLSRFDLRSFAILRGVVW